MKLSESPITHFVRGFALLATLIFVPGIAIFWNNLPKNFVSKPAPKPVATKTEEAQSFRKDSSETATSLSTFMSESIHPSLPATPIEPAISLPTPKTASDVPIQQVSWDGYQKQPPQNFELLEQHIKALGATYYRLEKWGNRGELFRFSCFVTPLEPHSYEKHFQAIGADAVTVMRSVITDIEAWKNATRE